jgi:myo-inositol-1(or 4)-monophosphatase
MDYQQIAREIAGIAAEAGHYVLGQYGTMKGGLKHDGSLVTEADAESERLIRARLRVLYPEHTIFGEEMGYEGPEDNDWIWYLDPIDGTSNFIFGLPMWGVSIGLAYRGRPVAGVFEMPVIGETFLAWQGGGAYCNGKRLAVNAPEKMHHTDLLVVASTVLERHHLRVVPKFRSLGCAAYALASLASGSFVGLVHDHWHLHDIAAGILLCWEAGAKLTTIDGRDFESFDGIDPKAKAPLLVGAAPHLQPELLQAVQGKQR